MRSHLAIAVSVAALTLLGFFFFPGHTFLFSDTQIYIPILERFLDPSVLGRDMVATRPHVSFTVYDEVALLLRRLLGVDFEFLLAGQQILFRGLGIFGVFLIATSIGLSRPAALLTAAAFSLGATIMGPTVLSFEYEPVPRGFAVPLLMLAVGLAAHGRMLASGVAASIAFLYHPPTTLAFWAVYFVLTLWPSKPETMSHHIHGLIPLAAAVLLMFALSRMQPGMAETQIFLTRLDPAQEQMQRWRSSYNWVSVWAGRFYIQYILLWLFSLGASFRLRREMTLELRFFALGLPAIGVSSVPLCYLLLEKWKWAIIPQVQPARMLLFVTVIACILGSLAGLRAARGGRWWEAVLWLLPVYAVPISPYLRSVFLPNLADATTRRRVGIILALAALATLAAWLEPRRRRLAIALCAAVLLVPFFLIPGYGRVRNFPDTRNPQRDELAAWAARNTPKDALFQFPDAAGGPDPSVFRARARRAVYADWKAGGQANFMKSFGEEWWRRWKRAMRPKPDAAFLEELASLGVDYAVLRAANRLPGWQPVYENSHYLVYRLPR